MKKQYLTFNSSQTQKIAKTLARDILKTNLNKKSIVVGLEGCLGSGKTTFLQGFARGLGIKEKILSPTFVILKKYKIQDIRCKIQNFYHIDCYRIENSKEILDLGFKEIISNPKNIVVIEWANRIKEAIPRKTIWIKFDFIDSKTRKIMIK